MKKPKQLRTTFAAYITKDCIGEGGSGFVYSATEDNGESVAIKVLDPRKATKEKLKRFENEYRFCSRNKHPNIITVLDHGLTDEQAPFFVMPLYKGSIRGLIGTLSPREALTVFEKILDGVEAAHKLGVTHRDLKPENLLSNGAGAELVVADFGIAEFEEEEIFTTVETKDGARLANFQYAAPEQRTRGRRVDKRADIYALGLILNELFTTELAYGTNFKTVASVTDEYPYLDILVEKMLQQDPTSRYNDIGEIKKELIARGEEHILIQKVSKLKDTVIPATEVDDPLIIDPVKIVDVDWENNTLSIKLNHKVNLDWIRSLQHIGSHNSLKGMGPHNFQFLDNVASISARAIDVQQVINYFKEWLPRANSIYEDKVKQDLKAAEDRQREELRRRIQQEEERANVKRNLKF
jgi:serine/threonine protein kinase